MKTFAIISLAILLAACGKDDDNSPNTPPSTIMEGNWAKTCAVESGSSGSQIETLSVEGTRLRGNITFYSDSACQTSAYEIRISNEILASTTKAVNLENTFDLDMSLSRVVVTPISAETVALFNSEKAYGISDWVVNGSTDVTGKTYEGADDPKFTKGTMIYDIFKVAGGSLNFGDSESGEGDTVAERPKALETTSFTKL